MNLHEFSHVTKRPGRKRVGRGDASGTGRTSGRGEKGAGSRSGSTYRPYFEGGQIPFFRRLPKRGFKNPNHQVMNVVNIAYLEETFQDKDEINEEILRAKGIIGKRLHGVKILGDGELSKALTVRATKFSASARQKIESAGGVCETV